MQELLKKLPHIIGIIFNIEKRYKAKKIITNLLLLCKQLLAIIMVLKV